MKSIMQMLATAIRGCALDLEEAQGLTAEDVRRWLRGQGWQRDPSGDIPGQECWALADGSRGTVWLNQKNIAKTCTHLAICVALPVQSLLREMNPRMRLGLPSLAAQEAHSRNGGVWIACHGELGNGGSIVFVSFDLHDNSVAIWDGDEWHDADSEMVADMPNWCFWPCDANGNKVRYPVDAKGVML